MNRFLLFTLGAILLFGCAQTQVETPLPTSLDSHADASLTPDACKLYQDVKGGIKCFGCGNGFCATPEPGYTTFTLPKDYIGVPYACYVSENGCELAQ